MCGSIKKAPSNRRGFFGGGMNRQLLALVLVVTVRVIHVEHVLWIETGDDVLDGFCFRCGRRTA